MSSSVVKRCRRLTAEYIIMGSFGLYCGWLHATRIQAMLHSAKSALDMVTRAARHLIRIVRVSSTLYKVIREVFFVVGEGFRGKAWPPYK